MPAPPAAGSDAGRALALPAVAGGASWEDTPGGAIVSLSATKKATEKKEAAVMDAIVPITCAAAAVSAMAGEIRPSKKVASVGVSTTGTVI